jgi:hypothetical protein
MFLAKDSPKQMPGDTEEESPQTLLESVDITLRGGVEVKLYLNRLSARGKFRWQTGRYTDPAKASGSENNPKNRLCSPDGHTPMAALRAWLATYGSKLEEASRKDVASRVWTKVLPTKLLRRNSAEESRASSEGNLPRPPQATRKKLTPPPSGTNSLPILREDNPTPRITLLVATYPPTLRKDGPNPRRTLWGPTQEAKEKGDDGVDQSYSRERLREDPAKPGGQYTPTLTHRGPRQSGGSKDLNKWTTYPRRSGPHEE